MKSTFAAIALSLVVAVSTLAQSARTFVSAGSGNDVNLCTRTAPCRSFGAALLLTAAGGEVVALDSGGYGPFTVTQAASVETPSGVYAGVAVTSGIGVTVNAGASDVVRLSGLTIVGTAGTTGIQFLAGSELVVDHCAIAGGQYGVLMQVPGRVSIVHSSVTGTVQGVTANASSGKASMMIDDSTFTGNGYGVIAQARSLIMLTNSLIEGSGAGGAYATTATADDSDLVIEHCGFSHNTNGVWADSSVAGGVGHIHISFSVITGSTNGLRQDGSSFVLSRGNNTIIANTNDIVGTPGNFSGQ